MPEDKGGEPIQHCTYSGRRNYLHWEISTMFTVSGHGCPERSFLLQTLWCFIKSHVSQLWLHRLACETLWRPDDVQILCSENDQTRKAWLVHTCSGKQVSWQIHSNSKFPCVMYQHSITPFPYQSFRGKWGVHGTLWWIQIHTRCSKSLLDGYSLQGKDGTSSSSPGVIRTCFLEDNDDKCQAVGVMQRKDISRKVENKNSGLKEPRKKVKTNKQNHSRLLSLPIAVENKAISPRH